MIVTLKQESVKHVFACALGQDPRRHPRIPRVYTTYKDKEYHVEKVRNSRRSVLDLTKLGTHGGLG